MLMAMLPRFVLLPDAALCFTCAADCVLVAPAGTTLQQHQQPRRHSSSSSSGGSGLRRHVAELEAKVCEQLQGSVKCHTDPFPAEFPCFLQLPVIESTPSAVVVLGQLPCLWLAPIMPQCGHMQQQRAQLRHMQQ